jgi:prepilin-type N-terminal cleavage/methylation domain-containing protein
VDEWVRLVNARGFTVAEMIVVLAIAGGLATLVAPTLSSYARTATLQAAARELATSINLGRQVAISRNTTVCVEVAAPTNIRLRTGGCSGAIWTGPGTDGSGAIKISNSRALLISTTADVVFTSLGAASPGGTYTLTNPTNNGTRTVVVAGSGRVSVR